MTLFLNMTRLVHMKRFIKLVFIVVGVLSDHKTVQVHKTVKLQLYLQCSYSTLLVCFIDFVKYIVDL